MLKKAPRLADDLFEKSSMSFGEHLEELRKALVKAFMWLGVGTAIGMIFGNNLVTYITIPMKKTLKEFQIERIRMQYSEANGSVPSDEFVAFMAENEVIPKVAFIDPRDIMRLSSEFPPSGHPSNPTQPSAANASSPEPNNLSKEATPTDSPPSEPAPAFEMWKGVDLELLSRLQPMRLWQPMRLKLTTFGSLDGFMIWLKAGLVAGAVLASPGVFLHIWQFLAAGLYPHERRYVYWYLPLSIVLFLSGICLAFYVIFPLVLNFLLTYNLGMDIEFEPRLNDYMSLALFLPLGFGVAFQLPLVMLALHRFGIVPLEMFISKWRISILAIAFASMVLTPADIYSMLGMFIPLTMLYFVGIFLCKFMPTGPGIGSQALDPQG